MNNVIDFYTVDRRTEATSDTEAIKALSSGALMQFTIDDDWKWWITLFRLVDFQIKETSIDLSVVDMGTRPYSLEFRQSTLEPVFNPVPLGYIDGCHQAIYALSLKNGAETLSDAVTYLLPQGDEV